MNIPRGSGRDRRLGAFLLASLCLVALGVLAVALIGSGGTLAGETAESDVQPAEAVTDRDRGGQIGGGSLGGAERNPIGTGIGTESNPFQNRSDELQFTVNAEQPRYWRVDGYDTYENGSWVRTGGYENYADPIDPSGSVTNEETVSVSVERDTAVLPTPWQPASVSDIDGSTLAISAETGIHTTSSLSAGNQYTVRAYQYDPDPRALVLSRANYPESIEDQYTALPEETSDRVRTLGDEITADAVTPVQAVCAVEDWIATNKAYDLDATHESGSDPVEQYLFEMDGGTAEYSASSMVVLLRSQGIPARYVTGYTPGEQVDNTAEYGVRAVNAHAWAEVYVTGHGWIPFDPTPVEDRLAIEQQAASAGGDMTAGSLPADCTVDVDVDSVPSFEFSETPEEETDDSEETTSDTDSEPVGDDSLEVPESANLTIETDPEPLVVGGQATATVLFDGEPLSGGELYVGEEVVGTTNEDGELNFTVPSSLDSGPAAMIVRTEELEAGQIVDLVEFELAADSQRLIGLPGDTVTVRATVGEDPVSGVEITQDGTVVGTTDAAGETTIDVSMAPTTTLEAEYLGASATTQIENRLVGLVLRALGVAGILVVVGAVLNREYNLIAVARARIAMTWRWFLELTSRIISGLRELPATVQSARKRGLRATARGVVRWPLRLVSRIIDRLPDSVLAYGIALVIQLYRSLRGLGGRTASQAGSPEDEGTKAGGTDEAGVSTSTTTDETARSVYSVWTRFVHLVIRRISPTQTPGEIARVAIEKGFPRQPVIRLTNAFRRVAYGPTRSENLVDEATSAFSSIEGDSTAENDGHETNTEEQPR